MIRVKKAKAKARLVQARKAARKAMEKILEGSVDPFVAYGDLYSIYVRTTALHDELKPFFRIPGIDPTGHIRVDDAFREAIRALAADYLSRNPK